MMVVLSTAEAVATPLNRIADHLIESPTWLLRVVTMLVSKLASPKL